MIPRIVSLSVPKGITSSTVSSPVVIVPVLSKHNTSTRANASIASISCTSAFFLARRPTPRIKETLVKSTSPSGIMPRTPATVLTRAFDKVSFARKY